MPSTSTSTTASSTDGDDCPECVTLITIVHTTTYTPPPVFVSTTIRTLKSSPGSTGTPRLTSSTVVSTMQSSPTVITQSSVVSSTSSPSQTSNVTSSSDSTESHGATKATTIGLGVAVPAFVLLLVMIFLCRRRKEKKKEKGRGKSSSRGVQDVNQMPMVISPNGEPIIPSGYLNGRHYATNSHGDAMLTVPYAGQHNDLEQRTSLNNNNRETVMPAPPYNLELRSPEHQGMTTTRESTLSAFQQAGAKSPSPETPTTPPPRPGRPDDMIGLTNHEIAVVSSADPLGYGHLAHLNAYSLPVPELAHLARSQDHPSASYENTMPHEAQTGPRGLDERLAEYNMSPSYSLASSASWERLDHQRNISPTPLRIIKQRDVQSEQNEEEETAAPPIPAKSVFRNGTADSRPRRFGPWPASEDPVSEEGEGHGRELRENIPPLPTEEERRMYRDKTAAYLDGKSPAGTPYRASSMYSRDEHGTPLNGIREDEARHGPMGDEVAWHRVGATSKWL